MKKFAVVILGLLLSINSAFATRYVTQTYPAPNAAYNYNPSIYNRNFQNLNAARLSEVEQSFYGRTYETQNPNTRMNRLEKSVFNRTYPNLPFDQRMNNLIMNYNNNSTNNYAGNFSQVSSRTGKLNNLINGLNGMFYGVPTGITPQVQPYFGTGSDPNWGRQSSYYGSKGWRTYNESVGGGTGIRILD